MSGLAEVLQPLVRSPSSASLGIDLGCNTKAFWSCRRQGLMRTWLKLWCFATRHSLVLSLDGQRFGRFGIDRGEFRRDNVCRFQTEETYMKFWIYKYRREHIRVICYDLVTSTPNSELRYTQPPHSETQSRVTHWCNPALAWSWSSDLTLLPVISSLSYFLYEHCFTLPYLSFPVLPSVMPIYFSLTHIRFLGPPSDPSGLSLYIHNTFRTWIVLCSPFIQTSNYISRTTPVYFLSSNLNLSST